MAIAGKPPVGRRSFIRIVGVTALGTLAGLSSGCKEIKRPRTSEITVKRESANRTSIDITANSLKDAERMTKPYGFYIRGLGRSNCVDGDAIFIAFNPYRVEYIELGGTRPRGISYIFKAIDREGMVKWEGISECDNGISIWVGSGKTVPTNHDAMAPYPYPGVVSRDEIYAHINLLIRNGDETTLNVALRIDRKALEARERRVFSFREFSRWPR